MIFVIIHSLCFLSSLFLEYLLVGCGLSWVNAQVLLHFSLRGFDLLSGRFFVLADTPTPYSLNLQGWQDPGAGVMQLLRTLQWGEGRTVV